jgi:hypothetical protein
MKKAKVFFHPIEDSGALTISWSSKPKGDAIEAKKGSGVGFFSDKGDLLCVIFDEVQSDSDHQILEFDRDHVEITVKNGKVTHSTVQRKTIARTRKKHLIRKNGISRLKK